MGTYSAGTRDLAGVEGARQREQSHPVTLLLSMRETRHNKATVSRDNYGIQEIQAIEQKQLLIHFTSLGLFCLSVVPFS